VFLENGFVGAFMNNSATQLKLFYTTIISVFVIPDMLFKFIYEYIYIYTHTQVVWSLK